MKALTALSFFMSAALLAQALPDSLERWKGLSGFFWSMDFSNEEQFKSDLKAYYAKIYRGALLTTIHQWVDKGSVESEYYSSHFDDLRDTHVISLAARGDTKYEVETFQDSCYSLEYNPPVMETIVAEYKVRNMTQEQIDSWLSSLQPDALAEVCLSIKRHITLQLNSTDGLIESEVWAILESEVRLSPNYAMQRSSRVGTPLAGTGVGMDRLPSASGAPSARRR